MASPSEPENTDDDSSYEGDEEYWTIPILRRRTGVVSYAVGARRSTRKRAKTTPPKGDVSAKLPRSISDIDEHLSKINKHLYGNDYDEQSTARVIRAALTLQRDYLLELKKRGTAKGKTLVAPKVRETVTRLFGVSTPTYTTIMKEFFHQQKLYSTGSGQKGRTGNTLAKTTRIPPARAIVHLVRDFVREERKLRKRVTATEVLHMLVDKGIVDMEKDSTGNYSKTALWAGQRAVRRFVIRNGYKRGKKKGTITPSPENEAKRDRYLRRLIENRALPPEERKREVYLDESYIHQHYKWKPKECLYDPNDDQDIQVSKAPEKGERYCFLCAIQSASPSPRGRASEDTAGMVPMSLWAFSPTRKQDHRGDYHKVFKGPNFIQWWRDQLLPNLNDPSIIIMDNASYHCTYADRVPKVYKAKTTQLTEYLTSVGIEVESADTLPILREKANAYIKEYEQWECVRLAEEYGHEVLFTPAYHSDLQPIELVWARVKGNIGRQYDINTKLSDVYERLLKEFDNLDTEDGKNYINKVIERTYRLSVELWNKVNKEPDETQSPVDIQGSSEDEQGDEVEGDVSDASSTKDDLAVELFPV